MDLKTTFQEYVERWAMAYVPLSHTPGRHADNPRFFLVDGFAGMADFMRSMEVDKSPVLCMEAPVSANIRRVNNQDWEYHDYTLYFCVRATKMNDGKAAQRAYNEALHHFGQFKRHINKHMRDFIAINKHPELDNINLTGIGPIWDGWIAVQAVLTVGEAYCPEEDEAMFNEELFNAELDDNDCSYGD